MSIPFPVYHNTTSQKYDFTFYFYVSVSYVLALSACLPSLPLHAMDFANFQWTKRIFTFSDAPDPWMAGEIRTTCRILTNKRQNEA